MNFENIWLTWVTDFLKIFFGCSVYLILRNFPEFRNFDRPAPPEKKLWKKKTEKKCCLRKIPEKPFNKDGKVPAFLPNPYKLIHLKAMPPKTCQTRTAGKEKKK